MKKFSVILVIILLFVQILPLYSFATSQDKEIAPYVPSIYDVYAGELSYEEYLELGGEPTRGIQPTGTYYLNNQDTGRYAKNNSGSAAAQSGLLSTHGTTIQWIIESNGTHSTIRSASDSTKYLASDSSSTGATMMTPNAGNISNCLWDITAGAHGGWIIKNFQTSKYLTVYGYSLYAVSATLNPDSSSYNLYVWRAATTSYYGTTSSHTKRELESGFSIRQLSLRSGESSSPTINPSPSNALWATSKDFTYSGYNLSYVSYNSQAGTFSPTTSVSTTCTMTVTATHKVTNRSITFKIVVLPCCILLGINTVGHDHYSALANIKPKIEGCGYQSVYIYHGSYPMTTVDGLLDANTNNIFVSRSHGGAIVNSGTQTSTYIRINNDDTNPIRYYSNQTMSTLDLSNMRLMMFIGCKTGAGGVYGSNLPAVAVSRGAETAIGFTDSIGCSLANSWTKDFFTLLEEGKSVYDACLYLDSMPEYSDSTLTNHVICGNKYLKIN